jgi:hypothetical protein
MAVENHDERKQFVSEAETCKQQREIQAGGIACTLQDRLRITDELLLQGGIKRLSSIPDVALEQRRVDRLKELPMLTPG